MDNAALKDIVLKLKDRIIKTEAGNMQLSETDTRQGLINPLFRALQWDFGDFESIKSELRVPKFNEPADYAFYSSKKKTDTPILLLEAKRLGSDLAHKNHVKQLTSYLGATGVQWGVLSDGNRYVLYNSLGGTSFEEQKFLTLEIKTVNTDSGFTLEEFVKHLTTLLSRDCLENDEIQQAYEEHMINSRIRLALDSLLSTPFDTLITAIRREFKEERVGLPDGVKVSKTHIDAYLASISDEAGRIPVDLEAEAIHTDEAVEDSVLTSGTRPQGERVRAHGKRVINDNYFCRSPRTGLAGSWVMAAACETARFPCGGRVGHECTGSAIARESDVRKDIGGSGGGGRDERADGAHVAARGVAVDGEGAADVADAGGPVRRCVAVGGRATAGGRYRRPAAGADAVQSAVPAASGSLSGGAATDAPAAGPRLAGAVRPGPRGVLRAGGGSGSGSGVRLHRRERPGRDDTERAVPASAVRVGAELQQVDVCGAGAERDVRGVSGLLCQA